MHPAPSIIFFTTLTGTGYGLLALIGALAAAQSLVPQSLALRLGLLAFAGVLVGIGLICSTFHLQHPRRAWRGLTQWRSSWLSREAVLALLTALPGVVFAWAWGVEGRSGGVVTVAGWLMAALALATIFCTGMIYASLKPIARWRHPLVVPVYLLLGLATGAVWGGALLGPWARSIAGPYFFWPIWFLAIAWGLKAVYWYGITRVAPAHTTAAATALGDHTVRELIPPHTQENWLLKEMAWSVGRKHAVKLRRIAFAAGLVVPAILLGVGIGTTGTRAQVLGLAAAAAAQVGVLIERWLFFAEAQHTVSLYYGAARA